MDDDRQLISASRLAAYRRCPRLHRIRYVDRVRPVEEASTLRFGTLVHRGLDAWWRRLAEACGDWRRNADVDTAFRPGPAWWAQVLPTPLDLAMGALDAAVRESPAPAGTDPIAEGAELVRAQEMLRAYDLRWRDDRLEPIAVEAEFRAPLINPETGARSQTFDLAGKVDVLARRWHAEDRYSEVVLVEHKTTSEDVGPGSPYRKRLRMDGQISVYHDGARALGHEVAACVYDVLVKPRIRPLRATPVEARKYTRDGRLYANQRDRDDTLDEYRERVAELLAADPGAYLLREDVVRLDAELDDARADVWGTARTIRDSELAGRWPRNPAACQAYGRDCEFFDVCSGGASLDDASRFTRTDRAHPELGQPTTTEEV